MSLDEIIEEVVRLDCPLVELTGGEPLLQPEIYELATRLADLGHRVLIETGGHRDISKLDERVIRIMDLKCPASGECDKNLWSNIEHLRPQDEVKFVIADRNDYEWALRTIRERGLEEKAKILISTAFGLVSPFRPKRLSGGCSKTNFARGFSFSFTSMSGRRTRGGCEPTSP
jgi:7-carboxy-7-deazaguanine synthase